MFENQKQSVQEAQGSGEGKAERQGTMPLRNTPDCSGKPTAKRGLAAESGDKLKAEA